MKEFPKAVNISIIDATCQHTGKASTDYLICLQVAFDETVVPRGQLTIRASALTPIRHT